MSIIPDHHVVILVIENIIVWPFMVIVCFVAVLINEMNHGLYTCVIIHIE
jgi:hypothetical protein